MRPRYLATGESPPVEALVVDSAVAGGALTLSHWHDSPAVPADIADDTSAGIVLRALRDPARLAPFTLVCNNHVDADGLIAIAAACRPEDALPHATMLIAAAEAGDFTAWADADALALMVALHRLILQETASGTGWEQRCYDRVVDTLPALIAAAAAPDPATAAAVARFRAARQRIEARDGIAIDRLGDLAEIRWRRRAGHAWDQFLAIDAEDDLPLHALGGLLPETCFQLRAEDTGAGIVYALDAPRHSWARTVRRPVVRWPDLSRARLRLEELDRGRCRWVLRPEAQRAGFVCQLASVDGGGDPAPSGLAPATVAAAIREALRLRR
jgi:hypothetical protein